MQKTNRKTVVSTQQGLPESPTKKLLTQSFGLLSMTVLLTVGQNAYADGIVKWKDDKGVTHYGDKIPAQYSNTENSIINKQGITVKRNRPMTYQDEAASQAKIEQDKKDKALLSAFTNENEIDLARDRNIQLDKVTVEGLQLQRTNSQKRLDTNQKYANNFTSKKKPVPADLAADIKDNKADLAKIDQQIADRNAAMEATRKRFDEDKQRYMMLKGGGNSSPANSTNSVSTAPSAAVEPASPTAKR